MNNEIVEMSCEAYIKFLRSDDYNVDEESNYKNDIFESAMEAVHGKKIWDEIDLLELEG